MPLQSPIAKVARWFLWWHFNIFQLLVHRMLCSLRLLMFTACWISKDYFLPLNIYCSCAVFWMMIYLSLYIYNISIYIYNIYIYFLRVVRLAFPEAHRCSHAGWWHRPAEAQATKTQISWASMNQQWSKMVWRCLKGFCLGSSQKLLKCPQSLSHSLCVAMCGLCRRLCNIREQTLAN
jgi:hypothetical protein